MADTNQTNNILDDNESFLINLIHINFRADKITHKFAHRHPNARNFIRELRAEKSCAKKNPRENIQT